MMMRMRMTTTPEQAERVHGREYAWAMRTGQDARAQVKAESMTMSSTCDPGRYQDRAASPDC